MASLVARLVRQFDAPIDYAVAYGSAVKLQKNHDASRSMIDLILAVEDPVAWHRANLRQFPAHYSGLRWFGPGAIAAVQEMGAGVYFNTHVPLLGVQVKYGVVSVARLEHDLRTWETLYLSGRLHKPVVVLRDLPRLRLALDANRDSALRVALLLLGPRFAAAELFHTIAGLSYAGDVRMGVSENPHKVANIVAGQADELAELYLPRLQAWPHTAAVGASTDQWEQAKGPEATLELLQAVPAGLAARVAQRAGGAPNDALQRLAQDPAAATTAVRAAMAETVAASSALQSLKGLFTAGVFKSIAYLGEKYQKRQAGLKQSPPPS